MSKGLALYPQYRTPLKGRPPPELRVKSAQTAAPTSHVCFPLPNPAYFPSLEVLPAALYLRAHLQRTLSKTAVSITFSIIMIGSLHLPFCLL